MKKRVLIVEDDPDIQEYYLTILEDYDLEIQQAFNGKEALSLINCKNHFDLIILDIVMPVMDGEVFLQKLRDEKNSSIPVILSTVDTFSATRIWAKNEVQGVFHKLGDIQEFIDMIQENLFGKAEKHLSVCGTNTQASS